VHVAVIARKSLARRSSYSVSYRTYIVNMDAAPQKVPVKLARVRKQRQRVDID